MTKRARQRGNTTWWAIGLAVVAIGLLAWWLSARRAEAPGLPASQPGARALSEQPGTGHDAAAPAHDEEHEHGEITGDEKADLDRIIRERGGAATP